MFGNAGTAEDMAATATPLQPLAQLFAAIPRSTHYLRFGKYRTPVSPEKSASMVQTVAPYCFAVA